MSRVERHAAEEEGRRRGRGSSNNTNTDRGARERAVISDAENISTEESLRRAGAAAETGRAGAQSSKKKHKGRVTPFGKFLNFFGTLIMLAAILLCLVLIVPRYAGIQSYVVVSGSMEPAIPVGSMVYAKETTPATLKTGDVIVFYNTRNHSDDGTIVPVTHRVVENDKEECQLITKGDANNDNDLSPVIYDNVVGIVLTHVPYLGYIAAPFTSMMGKIAVAMIILAGYLLTEVGSRLRRNV